ncbi:MAG: 4a-hydroxytetrahydrobiopterin dehydratase [Burkholderiaceae bacterium]
MSTPLNPIKRCLTATEIVTALAKLQGWKLVGDGQDLAIEKTFEFVNYYEALAFVNAQAFIAHRQDHHPELTLSYKHCVLRFNTHDVQGLSLQDFESATQVDALFI